MYLSCTKLASCSDGCLPPMRHPTPVSGEASLQKCHIRCGAASPKETGSGHRPRKPQQSLWETATEDCFHVAAVSDETELSPAGGGSVRLSSFLTPLRSGRRHILVPAAPRGCGEQARVVRARHMPGSRRSGCTGSADSSNNIRAAGNIAVPTAPLVPPAPEHRLTAAAQCRSQPLPAAPAAQPASSCGN